MKSGKARVAICALMAVSAIGLIALRLYAMPNLGAITTAASAPDVTIPWGDPDYTAGTYVMPSDTSPWFVDAFSEGGGWLDTADGVTGWNVLATDANYAALIMDVNRTVLTNDLVLSVTYFDAVDAAVSVDLLDTNGQAVVSDVAGNLLTGSEQIKTSQCTLPLASHPDAATIQLRCSSGGVAIYTTGLSMPDASVSSATGQGTTWTGVASASNGTENADAASPVLGKQGSSVGDETNPRSTITAVDTVTTTTDATNAAVSAVGSVVYVDAHRGSDGFSGRVAASAMTMVSAGQVAGGGSTNQTAGSSQQIASDGPKATIAAGLSATGSRDTLMICAGHYGESLNLAGRRGNFVISGNVDLSGRNTAVQMAAISTVTSNTVSSQITGGVGQ